MKLPRNLDGDKLAAHLIRHWNYEFVRQTGSHMRLKTDAPLSHAITIPFHRPLKAGTLASILKEVAEHKSVSVKTVLAGL